MIFGRWDVSPYGRPPEEWRAICRIRRAVQEYQMVQAGLRYQDLGYTLPGGDVPAWKLHEQRLIEVLLREASMDAAGQTGVA